MPFSFDHSYARLPERFFSRVRPTPVSVPGTLAVNTALGAELGLRADELQDADALATWAGNRLPAGAEPIALAYAGHQFGGFVPQLGDGRALLLGEVVGADGRRRDLQLKGGGPTPYSRGGDGRAALGPVLREYLVSEAMAALGIPTTRALAAVTTGDPVWRETPLPGAVLTRVASSHLRVGTFEYFAARGDREGLAILTDYALARHFPGAASADGPALALLDAVMTGQAQLVAKWLSVGFVHGVMNTDNTSICGETLDYGPCAFLDTYHPGRTFSSIDRHGRYAFAKQPAIAHWNVTRLAEALLPLLGEPEDRAIALVTERLEAFPGRFRAAYRQVMGTKLGLGDPTDDDVGLVEDLLALMAEQRVDFTAGFRVLYEAARSGSEAKALELFGDRAAFLAWSRAWQLRLAQDASPTDRRLERMARANPAFIPRNHRVEAMIAAATQGDLGPFARLQRVLARPFDDQEDAADLAAPPGPSEWSYRTFCGT